MQIKKFFYNLARSRLAKKVRLFLKIRPPIWFYEDYESYLASDLFIWRTDQEFVTIFKASNILQKYYGLDSFLKLIFYDSNGKFLQEKDFEFKENLISIKIDKALIGQYSYGTFCAFHYPASSKSEENIKVTNRCYVGYGYKESFSMVHGNTIGVLLKPEHISKSVLSIQPAIYPIKGKFKYFVQKKFDPDSRVNFCFSNPLNREIKLGLNNEIIRIPSMGCKIIEVDGKDIDSYVDIRSDYIWPRPLIMVQKNSFLDCLHG